MSASFVYLDENNNLSTTNSTLSGLFPDNERYNLNVDLEYKNKFLFGTTASDNIKVGNLSIKEVDIISKNLNISGNIEVVQNINVTDTLVSNKLQVKDKLLDSNGTEGISGQTLLSTSSGKLVWGQGTTANPIQYVADIPAVIALTAYSVDGSVAISASPRKLWLKSTVSGSAIWSSIDFIETATTLTSATGQINNTGTVYNFTSSGVGIKLLNQTDCFNITVVVEDDYAPEIIYPNTTEVSITHNSVSTSGTTHTFTAQINNELSPPSSGSASYTIILTDKNTSTIKTLPAITFTLNHPPHAAWTAPSVHLSNAIAGTTSFYSTSIQINGWYGHHYPGGFPTINAGQYGGGYQGTDQDNDDLVCYTDRDYILRLNSPYFMNHTVNFWSTCKSFIGKFSQHYNLYITVSGLTGDYKIPFYACNYNGANYTIALNTSDPHYADGSQGTNHVSWFGNDTPAGTNTDIWRWMLGNGSYNFVLPNTTIMWCFPDKLPVNSTHAYTNQPST